MREWEAATWATGQTEANVIRLVGQRLADRARQLTPASGAILILAGKGHNGDDARAARESLTDRGVNLLEISTPETMLPALDAALAKRPALVIDGLFGIGLDRPLAEPWQKVIAAVNAAKIPVLAVDIPSGLNADTGEIFGAAIEATVTLTVGAPKIGMLAEKAWPYVGRLEVAADIGLIPCPFKSEQSWINAESFRHFPPARLAAGHKGTYGHLAIIAGSFGYHGAAVLTTRGAQRAQPGLTTLYTQENVYSVVAPQLQSAMVNLWRPDLKLPEGVTGLTLGTGMPAREILESLRRNLQLWWRDLDVPVVLDASALDVLSSGPAVKRIGRVITPHPGEAARLLNSTTAKVQAHRVAAVRELSKKYGNCWVVLKGHQTVVGRSEGEIYINSTGNPHLAQGGSGDLLSGYIAGLLAQPPLQSDIAKTICYGVWQHGAAADKLQATRANWTIEDLANELGNTR